MTTAKNVLPPGKSYFASTNAAIDAISRCPAVPTNVIITVFSRYLLKGTQLCPMVTNRSEKLSNVACRGNSVGGKRNSSSSGLSEELIANTSGKAIRHATSISIIYMPISPPMERFGFLRLKEKASSTRISAMIRMFIATIKPLVSVKPKRFCISSESNIKSSSAITSAAILQFRYCFSFALLGFCMRSPRSSARRLYSSALLLGSLGREGQCLNKNS